MILPVQSLFPSITIDKREEEQAGVELCQAQVKLELAKPAYVMFINPI